jgi:hypothetical protein
LIVAPVVLFAGCKAKEGGECKVESKLTCEDPKSALACHTGKWEKELCKGPKGCVQKGSDSECDHTTAESGDVCTVAEDHSCSADKKSMVRCVKNHYVTVESCLGPGGCARGDKEATCDNSAAAAGDPCTQEGDLACALDGKSTVSCKGGKMAQGLPCKGPKGCTVAGTAVRCDDALSDLNDPCMATPGKDHYACAQDAKSLLKCDGGKFVQSDKCTGQKTCKLLGDVFGCAL